MIILTSFRTVADFSLPAPTGEFEEAELEPNRPSGRSSDAMDLILAARSPAAAFANVRYLLENLEKRYVVLFDS
jgi:hypothetical protein